MKKICQGDFKASKVNPSLKKCQWKLDSETWGSLAEPISHWIWVWLDVQQRHSFGKQGQRNSGWTSCSLCLLTFFISGVTSVFTLKSYKHCCSDPPVISTNIFILHNPKLKTKLCLEFNLIKFSLNFSFQKKSWTNNKYVYISTPRSVIVLLL